MDRQDRTTRPEADAARRTSGLAVPVAVMGLAMTMPLALAGQPAVSSSPRATVTSTSQDHADALLRCVSEAARRLWGAHAAAVHETGLTLQHEAPAGLAPRPADAAPAPSAGILPHLIDLPPPLA